MTLGSNNGRFLVDGKESFLLADTVWSSLIDATDDEWVFYLKKRSQQGFNGALTSVLPILHDRSPQAGGLTPFDEEAVRDRGSWTFDAHYFARMRERLDGASAMGITLGLVLLWVNYVEDTWGAERTPGFVMPEGVREEYLAQVGAVVKDGECLLVISGDASLSSEQEIASYRTFTEKTRQMWPQSLIAFHSAPTAVLPPELDEMADALIFQSGHHGESPRLALDLAARYRRGSRGRPVMNAEPSYEAHRVGGGVGRFGRSVVRRRIWESVVGGASEGVTYGAHGLWGWHRGGERFTSTHFSGMPLDWREALSLPGADDAATCRRLMESLQLSPLEVRPDLLTVADEGWGREDVVASTTADGKRALIYLPHGGPVTLSSPRAIALEEVVALPAGVTVRATSATTAGGTYIIDPPGDVDECLAVISLSQ